MPDFEEDGLEEGQTLVFHFEEAEPARLDKFLVACLPDFSRARLQGLIKDGLVLVAGAPAHKAGQVLDRPLSVEVTLLPPQPSDIQPEAIPLDVVFENSDVLVVNKPAGMVVHPAAGHPSGTLINAALAHAPDIAGVGGQLRPGLVHRLDKDTSGLILLAKNDTAQYWLQDQFRLRQAHKTYLALVDGHPPTPFGRIEAAIGRNPNQRDLMCVTTPEKGREAISEYQTLESFGQYTLLEVHPLTGRTHQIRVHLAFINAPVVADTIYGRRRPSLPLKRHFLHAARLTVTLPGQSEPQTFAAPLPPELEAILAGLRQSL